MFFTNSRRRIFGPFADPDASTPMTITIAGEKQGRPEVGAIAWLLSDDAYSGGLNLVNGGIVYKTERNLGGATAPIRAAGNCSITARETIGLSATRTITIEDEGALIFSPANDSRGNTVASALAGNGALLTSDVNRSGCAIAYTGDHTAFTGDYYIQGHARIAPGTFSAAARICLADGENGGVGVIETSGTIDRAPGAVKGGICWRTHDAYKTLGYGLRGGFAAKGGSLNVNLGGDARKLAVGSEYLPDGAVVQLQSQHADGELTLANGFELGGKTQRVNVWSGKTATIGGNVSDAVGGGKLDVTGNVAFSGTLEVGEMNLEGEAMLAVDGALDLTGAKVAIDADKESLAEFKADGLVLATATGAITGAPTFVTPPAGSWTLRVKDGALLMKASLGTVITLR